MILRLRRTRRGQLTLRVVHPVTTHRAEEDRRLPRLAEERDRRVGLADVNEPSCADLIVLEAFAIGANGGAVFCAIRHPGPMPRRQLRPRDCLEIEDVQRIADIGDEIWCGGCGARLLRDQRRQIE